MDVFRRHRPWVVAFVLAVILVVGYKSTVAPPRDFSPGTEVHITSGMSVAGIVDNLARTHVVRHPTLLKAFLRVTGGSTRVQTGLYAFDTPQNLFTIAYRLVTGAYGIPPARLTFVEGVTLREAAVQIAESLPGITATDFLTAAEGQEGYLFPDTYFFQPGIDAPSVVSVMRANFDTRLASLTGDITSSGRSLSSIVTMASIIEKEARTTADMHMVSGILWNRIELGMPLQVDAVFGYIFNRPTYSPSPADLKVNSPYNTYTHTGLPPGPINNPGLDALTAAINPTKTEYLYYLTGNDGHMYYARTYAGHQANLRNHLQ